MTAQAITSSQEQMRGKILDLEQAMLVSKDRIHLEAKHHFSSGVYMRELFIPRGVILTGKIHKTEHLNILSQGDLSVLTEDGMKRLKASTIIKSKPGMKRAGFAHEDSVWITVHPNPKEMTDPDELEAQLVTSTYKEFLEFVEANRPQIEGGA